MVQKTKKKQKIKHNQSKKKSRIKYKQSKKKSRIKYNKFKRKTIKGGSNVGTHWGIKRKPGSLKPIYYKKCQMLLFFKPNSSGTPHELIYCNNELTDRSDFCSYCQSKRRQCIESNTIYDEFTKKKKDMAWNVGKETEYRKQCNNTELGWVKLVDADKIYLYDDNFIVDIVMPTSNNELLVIKKDSSVTTLRKAIESTETNFNSKPTLECIVQKIQTIQTINEYKNISFLCSYPNVKQISGEEAVYYLKTQLYNTYILTIITDDDTIDKLKEYYIDSHHDDGCTYYFLYFKLNNKFNKFCIQIKPDLVNNVEIQIKPDFVNNVEVHIYKCELLWSVTHCETYKKEKIKNNTISLNTVEDYIKKFVKDYIYNKIKIDKVKIMLKSQSPGTYFLRELQNRYKEYSLYINIDNEIKEYKIKEDEDSVEEGEEPVKKGKKGKKSKKVKEENEENEEEEPVVKVKKSGHFKIEPNTDKYLNKKIINIDSPPPYLDSDIINSFFNPKLRLNNLKDNINELKYIHKHIIINDNGYLVNNKEIISSNIIDYINKFVNKFVYNQITSPMQLLTNDAKCKYINKKKGRCAEDEEDGSNFCKFHTCEHKGCFSLKSSNYNFCRNHSDFISHIYINKCKHHYKLVNTNPNQHAQCILSTISTNKDTSYEAKDKPVINAILDNQIKEYFIYRGGLIPIFLQRYIIDNYRYYSYPGARVREGKFDKRFAFNDNVVRLDKYSDLSQMLSMIGDRGDNEESTNLDTFTSKLTIKRLRFITRLYNLLQFLEHNKTQFLLLSPVEQTVFEDGNFVTWERSDERSLYLLPKQYTDLTTSAYVNPKNQKKVIIGNERGDSPITSVFFEYKSKYDLFSLYENEGKITLTFLKTVMKKNGKKTGALLDANKIEKLTQFFELPLPLPLP